MTTQSATTTDTTNESQSKTLSESPAERNPDGTFKKGVSGNPYGRPKGRKNQITALKQDLEIAIRENVRSGQIRKVVNKMIELALEGNVGAGKLILDKVLSNAREAEDERESSGGLKIVIEHANMDVLQQNSNIIDVKAEEIENEEREPAP